MGSYFLFIFHRERQRKIKIKSKRQREIGRYRGARGEKQRYVNHRGITESKRRKNKEIERARERAGGWGWSRVKAYQKQTHELS